MPRVVPSLLFALGAVSSRYVIFAEGAKYPFSLMELPYGEAELEPHISNEVCVCVCVSWVRCPADLTHDYTVLQALHSCVSAAPKHLFAHYNAVQDSSKC